tara:strand:- start:3128 stop:4093 length:966 start_codon:yes stop_codon:yes gene_type:complete
LIDEASKAGAEAIKFQTFKLDEMTINSNRNEFLIKNKFKNEKWNNRNLYSLYKEAQFPFEWHKEIFNYAKKKKLICFSSVFDQYSLDFLEDMDVVAYKIASLESMHFSLLKKICKTNKPLIVSTGTLSIKEIDMLVSFLKKNAKSKFAILHCVTEYPAEYKNLNLKTISYLRKKYNCPIGFSDHSKGIGAAIASISLGACIIEKHFKLKGQNKSLDSDFSADPNMMKILVQETKNAWLSQGKIKKNINGAEKIYKKYSRSIYVTEDIRKGELLSNQNIKVIRPGLGVSPIYYDKLVGKKSPINLIKNTPLKKNFLKKIKLA